MTKPFRPGGRKSPLSLLRDDQGKPRPKAVAGALIVPGIAISIWLGNLLPLLISLAAVFVVLVLVPERKDRPSWGEDRDRDGRPNAMASLTRADMKLEELASVEPSRIGEYQRLAVDEFRRQIEIHRRRALGDRSEWAKARAELVRAVSEAQGSVAYWEERVASDPESELAQAQLEVAEGLEAKLFTATAAVDERANKLLRFYGQCEAKIDALEVRKRDIEQVRKLSRLSERADLTIATAEGTIEGLARDFVKDAAQIAEALGAFDRRQVKVLAGDAPLDNIEELADQIIQSSDDEQRAIRELERAL